MSELNTPPSGWWWNADTDSKSLGDFVKNNKGRIISLKSFVENGKRRFAAFWVAKGGVAGNWTAAEDSDALGKLLDNQNSRLVALDVFMEKGKRTCAAAWIKNDSTRWWWHPELERKDLKAALKKNKGRLTTLRSWVNNGMRKLASIWIANDGMDWDWHPSLTEGELAQKLEDDRAQLVSLDTFVENGKRKFAAAWVKNTTGLTWFWNSGSDPKALGHDFDLVCAYPMDVAPYGDGSSRVAAIMYQYPTPPYPANAHLLDLSGSASLLSLDPNEVYQTNDLQLTMKNVANSFVQVESLTLLRTYTGGSVDVGTFSPFDPRQIFAAKSTTMLPQQTYANNATLRSDIGCTHVIIQASAKDQLGNEQYTHTKIPILRAGYEMPKDVAVPTPVFTGLWTNPVEVVPLWLNGKQTQWLTVGGQVVNGTGKAAQITLFHLTVQFGGKTVMDMDLAREFYTHDDDSGFTLIKIPEDGAPKLSLLLSFFIHGSEIKLPSEPKTGTLTLAVNYRLDGACRAIVYEAPIQLITPVTVRAPVQGTWNFGNSPNHIGWDAHAWPGQRYSIDFGILDEQGNTFHDDAKVNENFYCWKQPIFAMADGKVIGANDSSKDHDGRKPYAQDPAPPPNYVYIDHGGGKVSGYFHLKHGSIPSGLKQKEKDGMPYQPPVHAGDLIGHVGNSGGSSEPHLHIGYVRLDKSGRGNLIPLQFSNVKTLSGRTVVGVPATDQYKTE